MVGAGFKPALLLYNPIPTPIGTRHSCEGTSPRTTIPGRNPENLIRRMHSHISPISPTRHFKDCGPLAPCSRLATPLYDSHTGKGMSRTLIREPTVPSDNPPAPSTRRPSSPELTIQERMSYHAHMRQSYLPVSRRGRGLELAPYSIRGWGEYPPHNFTITRRMARNGIKWRKFTRKSLR